MRHEHEMYRTATTTRSRSSCSVVAISPVTNTQYFSDKDGVRNKSSARVIGSAVAGASELLLFHPVDTVAKRLMSNQSVVVKGQSRVEELAAINKVRYNHAVYLCITISWNSAGEANVSRQRFCHDIW